MMLMLIKHIVSSRLPCLAVDLDISKKFLGYYVTRIRAKFASHFHLWRASSILYYIHCLMFKYLVNYLFRAPRLTIYVWIYMVLYI